MSGDIQEDEKKIFKSVDEIIKTMEENHDKFSTFIRLFQERADENAIKIWYECFREAYGTKQNND
jgi:hypothetical protein